MRYAAVLRLDAGSRKTPMRGGVRIHLELHDESLHTVRLDFAGEIKPGSESMVTMTPLDKNLPIFQLMNYPLYWSLERVGSLTILGSAT